MGAAGAQPDGLVGPVSARSTSLGRPTAREGRIRRL